MARMKVMIMGGGLAGLAAAVHLVDNGVKVVLLEAEEELGGRATSWRDADGDTIDSGLHLFFPFYVNTLDFLDKIGAGDRLLWTDRVTLYKETGEGSDLLATGSFPIPLHAIAGLLHYHHISLSDLMRLLPAILSSTSLERSDHPALDQESIEAWLHIRLVSSRTISYLVSPLTRGLTFLEPWEASAETVIDWARNFIFSGQDARVGFLDGGLGEIGIDTARAYIESRGGEVKTGKRVTGVNISRGKAVGVEVNGTETYRANSYLSALPPWDLLDILPREALRFEYFAQLGRFEIAPSMSVQIWFEEKVTQLGHLATGCQTTISRFADLTNIMPSRERDGGSLLEILIAPAGHLASLSDDKVYSYVMKDLARILPRTRQANVRKRKIIRERQGLPAQEVGLSQYRPFQRSPVINLYLAGDYTNSRMSASMEGAVASGRMAAALILADRLAPDGDPVLKPPLHRGLAPFIKPGITLMTLASAAALAFWYRSYRRHL